MEVKERMNPGSLGDWGITETEDVQTGCKAKVFHHVVGPRLCSLSSAVLKTWLNKSLSHLVWPQNRPHFEQRDALEISWCLTSILAWLNKHLLFRRERKRTRKNEEENCFSISHFCPGHQIGLSHGVAFAYGLDCCASLTDKCFYKGITLWLALWKSCFLEDYWWSWGNQALMDK